MRGPRRDGWQRLVGRRRHAAAALAGLAMVLALGLEDSWEGDAEVDPAERWRAGLVAYFVGVVASVTFVVSVALINRLEAALF